MAAHKTILGREGAKRTLYAMPTAEQYQELWDVIARLDEFGTDVVFAAVMDAAHSAYVKDEDEAFDMSSLTWESVGRLALYVDDTRWSLRHILKSLDKIEETLPLLREAIHRAPDSTDMAPPWNRYGGEYDIGWPEEIAPRNERGAAA